MLFISMFNLLDGVDGEFGQGVGHGVGLHLADGLQAAGLLLDVHVVEGGVHQVNAGRRNYKRR